MNHEILASLSSFLKALCIEEQPIGTFFTDKQPTCGYSPGKMELPTLEKESKNEVNWQSVFSDFSCVIQKIWIARKKKTIAYFSAEQFGCVGGAFYLGFVNPMPETIIQYISTGITNVMEGERYYDCPDNARKILLSEPVPASADFCVFKPLDQFKTDEYPVLVSFFVRPETLSGLHRLATYVTNDPEVVMSPSAAACGSLVGWPLHYLSKGLNKAVIGGMDPSARKFFKTDELTLTIPFDMFAEIINRFDDTFLMTDTWKTVKKKIAKRNRIVAV